MSAQILIGLIGTGGLLSAIVTFVRLRPDANMAAVTQSKGAVETMALLLRELERDRDHWKSRATACEAELAGLRVELERRQDGPGRRNTDST